MIERGSGWEMHLGDCLEVLPTIEAVDHVITDPPYSDAVHGSVRSSGRQSMPDAALSICRTRRVVDLGFEHLRPVVRRGVAGWCGRNVRRWAIAFSDAESSWLWRLSFVAAGLDFVRTAEWRRLNGAPQFSGDRPAQSFEPITLAHRKGRKRWNGGGKQGAYEFPIVLNRNGHRGERVHTAQKPDELMLALVTDYSDEGELVCDPFTGSGTTGVACLRLGRRFIGIERSEKYFALACERLRAEEQGLSLSASRAGQLSLLGGTK